MKSLSLPGFSVNNWASLLPPFLFLLLDSHEAAYSYANCSLPLSQQVSEVDLPSDEGLLLRQSILTAGGVRGLYERGSELEVRSTHYVWQ